MIFLIFPATENKFFPMMLDMSEIVALLPQIIKTDQDQFLFWGKANWLTSILHIYIQVNKLFTLLYILSKSVYNR